MEGGPNFIDVEERGIIPRAVAAIFEGIANADPALEFTLKISYVEICEWSDDPNALLIDCCLHALDSQVTHCFAHPFSFPLP